ALNIPVQGTAADGFKLAMIKLQPLLRELGGRGVLCVHDEYIAEVPQAVADDACVQVREAMEQAMAEVVTSVPIVVEAHVADTWG
ncbi:MAG: DNA polymerase, partial [Nannocystaceae bacterium]